VRGLAAPAQVERHALWQLHRIDAKVPRDEQFGVLAELVAEGKVRHVGLSEVSVEEIEAARRVVPIASVQNRYNLAERGAEPVLEHCAAHDIAFIPWYPLLVGKLARPGGALDRAAARLGAAPAQVALAWLLRRSPVTLPIPGTSKVKHLEENVAAAGLALTDEELAGSPPNPRRRALTRRRRSPRFPPHDGSRRQPDAARHVVPPRRRGRRGAAPRRREPARWRTTPWAVALLLATLACVALTVALFRAPTRSSTPACRSTAPARWRAPRRSPRARRSRRRARAPRRASRATSSFDVRRPRRGGPDSVARASARDREVPLFRWAVRLYAPGDPRETVVRFAPDGRPIGLYRALPETSAVPR
jgi:hypothetical protein